MDLDQRALARIRLGINEAVSHWIYDPNVSFIDFGWRETGGKLFPDEPAIRVHVKEKYVSQPALEAAVERGRTSGPIPDQIAGFPVDSKKEQCSMVLINPSARVIELFLQGASKWAQNRTAGLRI